MQMIWHPSFLFVNKANKVITEPWPMQTWTIVYLCTVGLNVVAVLLLMLYHRLDGFDVVYILQEHRLYEVTT